MLEAIGELGTPSAIPTLESLRTFDSMLTRMEVKKSITRIQNRYADGGTSAPPEMPEPELHGEQIEANEPSPSVEVIEPESNLSYSRSEQGISNSYV